MRLWIEFLIRLGVCGIVGLIIVYAVYTAIELLRVRLGLAELPHTYAAILAAVAVIVFNWFFIYMIGDTYAKLQERRKN